MDELTTSRLDRIEQKLDEIAYIMVSLAKAEEKIESLKKDHDQMYDRINKLSVKLDDIEKKVDENHRTVCLINKLFWLITVAVAGSIASQFIGLS